MMKFLTRCWNSFRALSSSKKASNDDGAPLQDGVAVARFIFSRKHFSKMKGTVKPVAFGVVKGETSVIRIDGASTSEIWKIGKKVVGAARGMAPKAYAELESGIIREVGLDVVAETRPHPRHANIIGWPPSDEERQSMFQIELALKSILRVASS